MGVWFSVLGPLTAEFGTAEFGTAELGTAGSVGPPAELDIGPFKQRLLLALLLCRCNGVVLVEQMIDTLWWDGPPRTARKNIQVYVTHLRKLLETGQSGRLRFRPPGYQLDLTAREFDALRFDELSRAGRVALRRGDAHAAAAAIRQALGLWRGPALADLQVSPVLRDEAMRLDDRRLAAYEDWFEAELLLGNHAEVLDKIEAVVRAHPLRERLRSHQLTALYRGGRQAEALAEYDNLRQLLAAELGLEPSAALQRLYQDILAGHPSVVGAPTFASIEPSAAGLPQPDDEVMAHLASQAETASVVSPADGLPRVPDDFTGRQQALAELLAFFDPAPRLRRLAAISGPPGAGATTLALRVAHVLAPRFRDGAILLSLRGSDGTRRPPAHVAGDLLGQLESHPGRPGGPPGDKTTLLRSRLARLQLLLILDDAADEGQVRPLLPGAGDCSVILTSSRDLSGLEGITRFPLGPFTEEEALELLGRIIGTGRAGRARPAARRIVRACGLLPLAIRIAGARLASLDHLPLERFADRLENTDRLLDELTAGDLSVRERFDRYQRGLTAAERLALMQVAAAWGPWSKGPGEAERLLERLTAVHALVITEKGIDPLPRPLPFAMPAPLWAYAQQLLTAATAGARPDPSHPVSSVCTDLNRRRPA